jgi:hypothetical protein
MAAALLGLMVVRRSLAGVVVHLTLALMAATTTPTTSTPLVLLLTAVNLALVPGLHESWAHCYLLLVQD